eukprot:gnl/TRDRNA2_/TRDRNA2_36482_c0_seq1.p1 gnl/TRDRNA2_/TRDRNA2_36482_c0~~gnl/TRDRNA2_/TRDRNA2_36482_c0_seq1.p1  ORF type:complete len:221 (+),score=31.19 gnl/TRDRNA2_/TRDRNA2_36482_c0_seq1:51-665(+)
MDALACCILSPRDLAVGKEKDVGSAPTCSHCRSRGNLKRCTACKEAHYCSVACQRADISRHREEDGCGRKPTAAAESSAPGRPPPALVRSGSSAFQQPSAAKTAAPSPAAAQSRAAASRRGGPACQRCQNGVGEASSEHFYAAIVARSIYAKDGECMHGPYCSGCADKMQRQVLSFCMGCNALINTIQARQSDGAQSANLSSLD